MYFSYLVTKKSNEKKSHAQIQYYTFHDRDVAPEGKTLEETNKNLDTVCVASNNAGVEATKCIPLLHILTGFGLYVEETKGNWH